MWQTDESHVRKVIHEFNERGLDSLDPDYRGGRPRTTTPAQRDRVVAVARTRPDHQGVALTRWSIPKLAAHLDEIGVRDMEELGTLTVSRAEHPGNASSGFPPSTSPWTR